MAETIKKVKRSAIAHYLDTTPTSDTRTYDLMNLGISGLTVDYAPETSSSQYIADNNATTEVNSYAPTTSIEQEVIKGDKIYDFINSLRRRRATFSDAYTTMITVEAYDKREDNNYPAEKQTVSIQIDEFGGDQPDPPHISYTINFIGSPVQGYFNVKTKEFSEDGSSGGEGGSGGGSGGNTSISSAVVDVIRKSGMELGTVYSENDTIDAGGYINEIDIETAEFPNATSSGNRSLSECFALTSVSMPKVTTVSDESMLNCISLTSIDLPVATNIGDYAFRNCVSLTTINLPAATDIGTNDMYNAGGTFENCISLTSIDLPVAKNIRSKSFINCISLTSIDLPNVTDIMDHAFENCISLTSISLPNAKSIGDVAFQKCRSLKSVDLPNVPSIAYFAFDHCSSLTRANLHIATSIDICAFQSCESLTSVIIGTNQVCTLKDRDAFLNTPIARGTGYIYVPDELVDSYKTATNWSVYANQIKPMSEYIEGV